MKIISLFLVAILCACSANNKDPGTFDVLNKVATAADQSNHPSMAEHAYLRALSQKPDDLTVLSSLADLYSRHHNFGKAIPLYQRICQLEPHNTNANYFLARSLLLSQQYDAALVALHDVLKSDEHHSRALSALGLLLDAQKSHSALQCYLTALKYNPGDANCQHNLALSIVLHEDKAKQIKNIPNEVLHQVAELQKLKVDNRTHHTWKWQNMVKNVPILSKESLNKLKSLNQAYC